MVHEAREFLSPRYEREKEKEKAVISKCWKEMASLNVNYVVLNVSVGIF